MYNLVYGNKIERCSDTEVRNFIKAEGLKDFTVYCGYENVTVLFK